MFIPVDYVNIYLYICVYTILHLNFEETLFMQWLNTRVLLETWHIKWKMRQRASRLQDVMFMPFCDGCMKVLQLLSLDTVSYSLIRNNSRHAFLKRKSIYYFI
jgi:hypothetical protein